MERGELLYNAGDVGAIGQETNSFITTVNS